MGVFIDVAKRLESSVNKHCEQWPEVNEYCKSQFLVCMQTLDEFSGIQTAPINFNPADPDGTVYSTGVMLTDDTGVNLLEL